jgi:FKBP-type peptidyl-prolyl cis-trans isomerase
MCMKKYLNITGAGLFALAFIFSSCVSTPDYTPPDYDAVLQQYLDAVNKTKLSSDLARLDDSLHTAWHYNDVQSEPKGGVRYRILKMGTGEKPALTSSVLFKYKGVLFDSLVYNEATTQVDGKAFDENQTPSADAYSPVARLIAGMQTTLPLLPEGTIVQMFIPSGLGYGPDGYPNPNGTGDYIIPKNSNLFFQMELVDVYTPQQ